LIWETKSWTVVSKLEGHEGSVSSAVFSRDGKLVLTQSGDVRSPFLARLGSSDNTARLWETEAGKQLSVRQAHSAALSLDGKRLISAPQDDTALIWETGSGRAVPELVGHTDKINAMAFSADGKLIVTTSRDRTARVWETATGRSLAVLGGH